MSSTRKKFAGIAQPLERRGSLPEGAGENPAPRSIRQAIAAGLRIDPAVRQLGREDGLAGIFRLSVDDIVDQGEDFDVLAYLDGWAQGNSAKNRRG